MRKEIATTYIFLFYFLSFLQAQVIPDTTSAVFYIQQADSLFNQKEYDLTILEIDKALNLHDSIASTNHLQHAQALYIKGNTLYKQRNYEEALIYLKQSADIRISLNNISKEFTSVYNVMGVCHYTRGRYEEALNHFHKALDIATKIPGEIGKIEVAKCYNNLGVSYRNKEDFTKALECFEKCRKIRFGIYGTEDHLDFTKLFQNLGNCYSELGDHERAIIAIKKSLSIRRENLPKNHLDIGDAYDYLGYMYLSYNKLPEARYYFEKAEEIYAINFSETDSYLGGVKSSLASTYWKTKDYDKALEYFEQALVMMEEEYGSAYHIVNIYYEMGQVYLEQDQFEQAEEKFEEGKKMATTLYNENSEWVAFYHWHMGALHAKEEKFELANVRYEKALEILGYKNLKQDAFSKITRKNIALKILTQKIENLHNRYAKTSELKYLQEAVQTSKSAFNLFDVIRTDYEGEGTKQYLIDEHYSLFNTTINVYEQLHLRTQENQYIEQAFLIAERGKSALLLEAVKNADARAFAGIPPESLEKERALRIDIAYLEKQLYEEENAGDDKDQVIIDNINSSIFDKKAVYSDLIKEFERKYPDYYQLKYETENINVANLQENILNEDQAMLSYFVGEETLYAFLITKDTLVMHSMEKDFQLRVQVQELVESINQYPTTNDKDYLDDVYVNTAHQLYKELIEPFTQYLPKQLIIIPHDVLGYLPFEVLLKDIPDKKYAYRSHPYILNDYQISYSYSVGLLQEMNNRKNKRVYNTLLAFAPSFDGDYEFNRLPRSLDALGELKMNEPEIQRIKSIIGGDIFVGEEATENKFTELASDYKIIHLATHGKANAKSGDYCFLAFSEKKDSIENELLYAKELYHLQLNADMVVLSACETATGELQKGEGIVSLARGFSYAGAKSIITTLWSINDATTSDIMTLFYENIKEGMYKDEALRTAKQAFIEKNRNDLSHPVYWAAFVPVGNMDPISLHAGWKFWLGFGIMSLILFGGGYLFLRKR